MKVNNFGMLIKFAAFYLCINFVVVSAVPIDEKNSDKQTASIEKHEKIEDYDAVPTSEKPIETSNNDTKPPLVFPSDDDKSTSKNETALEILQKNSNTSLLNEKSSTENKEADKTIRDEKDYDDKEEKVNENKKNTTKEQKTPKPEDLNNNKKEDVKEKDYDEQLNENDDGEKNDAENIQENQEQGDLEERYGVNSTSINVFEEPTLKAGQIAFIFATCLVFLSVTAYVGLILWRKSLERRYGMRQRLVTEDDYYNNNDVRFFGL